MGWFKDKLLGSPPGEPTLRRNERHRGELRMWRAGPGTARVMVLAMVVAGGACAAPGPGQPRGGLRPIDPAAIQRTLNAAVDPDVVGGLIRVDGSGASWSATAGSAVAGQARPVDPSGTFRAASITKTFVATVVLQLVEENKLGLDTPIQRYAPSALPTSYPPITIRELLQNTSGLRNYLPAVQDDPEQILRDRRRVWTPEQLLAIAVAQPRDFEPGTKLEYSVTNYVLLGMLIRRVTGNGWGAEVARRITRPLGLDSTYDPGTDPTLRDPHAHGYLTMNQQGRPTLVDITELSMTSSDAGGAMVSSARDLNVFFDALLGGRLLTAPLLEQMLTPTDKGQLFGDIGWGLGIMRLPLPEGCGEPAVFGTGAGIPGFAGLAFATRDGQRRVTISLNTTSNDPTSQAGKMIALARLAFCAPAGPSA